ncbi:hypothetical protein HOP52_05275 [Halomonas campisalis]|uniref:Ribbon-helix-helix protein CopG domain-containing protein n=1 Tax=Billgrantia campisalis TaxID=74661 RepID=A0ABS9P5Y5_9GAMM|nr:hypothetical protein [Halomonas campisalis]MCG6657190.1 hypothetical protein [Halomonas campisalis]MDR5862375.1 hypothetical protein [Halomonas campisalis]
MPHLLRFSHDIEARLERLCQQTGMSKSVLIERCVATGLADLESQLLVEGAEKRPATGAAPSLDQVLRESGLGA